MKKRHIFKRIIVSVLVLAVLTAGVLYATGVIGGTAATSATTYEVSKTTTGDLEESVKGTGTLESGDSLDVTAPFAVTVDKIKVTAGQSVKKGDLIATLDTSALDSTIASLQTQIENYDSQLAQLLKQQDSTTSVTANIKGRVKKIYASKGDDVKNTVSKYGGLMLLSTDGKMKLTVTLADSNSVSVGDDVTVKTGGDSYDGTVAAISDDKKSCTVTLTDNGPKLDAKANVYDEDNNSIGSGKLEINQPVAVTATSGIVKKINVSLNQKVSANKNLVSLKDVPYTDSYTSAAASRATLVEQLKEALLIKKAGGITASQDGVINEIKATDGSAVKEDETILSMYTGGATNLSISIDELDISKIKTGQKVTVVMDAISDKTYEGSVTAISEVGTTSNGVTTYPVTVKLTDDGNLKLGMSATATIVIDSHTNVLMIPISALQTSNGKSYVWKYTGTLPTDSSSDPGTKTEVEYGLSNDNYVEITSGLTSSDQVVTVTTKSTTTTKSSSSSNGNSSLLGGLSGGGAGGAGGGGPQGGGPG